MVSCWLDSAFCPSYLASKEKETLLHRAASFRHVLEMNCNENVSALCHVPSYLILWTQPADKMRS